MTLTKVYRYMQHRHHRNINNVMPNVEFILHNSTCLYHRPKPLDLEQSFRCARELPFLFAMHCQQPWDSVGEACSAEGDPS